MSHDQDELLSAFVDAELTELEARRCARTLFGEAHGRAQWARYHVIRDTLQGRLSHALEGDLAGRVRAQLEQEPRPGLAPKPAWRTGVVKPAAGLAVAASVAVVAFIGLHEPSGPSQSTPVRTPLVQSESADRGEIQQAGVASLPEQGRPGGEESVARFNSYLVNHAEYASNRGMLPAARIVGYDMTASAGRR